MPRASSRRTELVELLSDSVGMQAHLRIHKYGPEDECVPLCYIQASLHADEIPGILVNHHLIKMLDKASKAGWIVKRVHIVPYANPIGLYQTVLNYKLGRFNLATGTNFNRAFADVTDVLIARGVLDRLREGEDAEAYNTQVIREALASEYANLMSKKDISSEAHFKLQLLSRASQADIVLDLHCDCNAQLHLYTHTNLWPQLKDLACELQANPTMLAIVSGGVCFEEACSNPFYVLGKKAGDKKKVAMACESATVELRGEGDVNDEFASRDARAIFRFLQRRGYINSTGADGTPADVEAAEAMVKEFNLLPSTGMEAAAAPLPPLLRDAYDLSCTDLLTADVGGVISWKVNRGDFVKQGQLLAEIVNLEVSFGCLYNSDVCCSNTAYSVTCVLM